MQAKKTVLIVDDSEINREVLENILEQEYEVLQAENGKVAFSLLKQHHEKIAAILLDLVMPQMDGYEFLEKMSEQEKYENIPVIVSTGNSDRENEKHALQLGAWDFISKPYDPDIVKFRLKNVIDRSLLTAFERVKYISEFDVLTGIYNKNNFFVKTLAMLRTDRKHPYVFIRMDISRFSLVNSYYGMKKGDELLIYIADFLRQMAEQKHSMTYGCMNGDEFALCFSYEDEEEVSMVTRQIREYLNAYDITFNLVPIFGIYYVKEHDMEVPTMLDNASMAAKQVKGNYINTECVYTDVLRERLDKEQEIINEMNPALEEEQFVVYLQPKYALGTDRPAGSEALVRWIHPVKGMISPGAFIPVFEQNGFVEKLDYYMWEHTCQIIRSWIDRGIEPLPVSVNVSRVNLYNPNLVQQICDLADRYQVPHDLLNLEITESAYTENYNIIVDTLESFHQNGFIVLMDDFGSGYSSLNSLKDIEVDVIKIDMRFFEKANSAGRAECIISAVVRMAKWLGMEIVAEGVETIEQVEFLRSVGCQYVQGYYFAKPMPVNEYEALIQKNEVYQHKPLNESAKNNLWIMDADMQKLLLSVNQPMGIYELNADKLECIKVNQAFYNTFGYEDSLLYSDKVLEVVGEEYREDFTNAVKQAVETRADAQCDYLRHCLDGRKIWVRVNIKYVEQVAQSDVLLISFMDLTLEKETSSFIHQYQSIRKAKARDHINMLVVDDLEINRDIMIELFGDKYNILTAENGRDAIEKIRENEEGIDIIILDLAMPVMNGEQFLEYKRNQTDMADIPVIIFTADESPKTQKQTVALGAQDYITRPFVKEVIEKRIDNVISSYRNLEI